MTLDELVTDLQRLQTAQAQLKASQILIVETETTVQTSLPPGLALVFDATTGTYSLQLKKG